MSDECKDCAEIDRLTDRLGEHWDAVQILVSRGAEGGGTERYFVGSGNWYARQGMAQKFITMDEAEFAADSIAKAINPSDE